MPDFWFRGLSLFDGHRFLEDWHVLTSGSRIVYAGPVEPPVRDQPQEWTDGFLMPGVIDCHVHLGLMSSRKVLEGGVTTARDLGWPPEQIFQLVREVEGSLEGPDLLAAGPMITAVNGYPSNDGWAPPGTARPVRDANDARAAVMELAQLGACIIKVAQEPRGGDLLPPALLAEVARAAGEAGLLVTSHVGSLEQLELALVSGISELAHGLWSDEVIDHELAARMVAANVTVVPTLHIDPSEERLESLRRFISLGGRVIYGTDMGNSGPPPGIDAQEIELMMKAGMSLTQTLAACTSSAANHLGLDDRGKISDRARADLVLLAGDPRESGEIEVSAVVKAGRLVS